MDLKELKAIVALCRKEGVEELELGGVKIRLGAKPLRQKNMNMSRKKGAKAVSQGEVEENGDVPSDGDKPPTNEELLLWSAGGGLPFHIENMPGSGGDIDS